MRAQVAARGRRRADRPAGLDQPAGPHRRRSTPVADLPLAEQVAVLRDPSARRLVAEAQEQRPALPARPHLRARRPARLRARRPRQHRGPGRTRRPRPDGAARTTCSSATTAGAAVPAVPQLLRRQPRRRRRDARPPAHRARPQRRRRPRRHHLRRQLPDHAAHALGPRPASGARRSTCRGWSQRQCRATAETVGLLDRGVARPRLQGRRQRHRLRAPRARRRRGSSPTSPPAASGCCRRRTGYLHTFVSGVEVYADGEPTGDLPGRLVRARGRPPPEDLLLVHPSSTCISAMRDQSRVCSIVVLMMRGVSASACGSCSTAALK